MQFINQDWIIEFFFGFIIVWISAGTIALFGFMRCQYRDRKIVDPQTDPWLFFGIENSFMFFSVVVICLFGILGWPILFREKYNYEHGIEPEYSLN